jgi:hypothetical protein
MLFACLPDDGVKGNVEVLDEVRSLTKDERDLFDGGTGLDQFLGLVRKSFPLIAER